MDLSIFTRSGGDEEVVLIIPGGFCAVQGDEGAPWRLSNRRMFCMHALHTYLRCHYFYIQPFEIICGLNPNNVGCIDSGWMVMKYMSVIRAC